MKVAATLVLALVLAAPATAQDVVTLISPLHLAAGGSADYCPDGLVSLSGGFDPSDPDNALASVSFALVPFNQSEDWRWSLSMFTRTLPYEAFRIGIVCADVPDPEIVEDEFPVPAAGIGSDSVLCPLGTVAVSGGTSIVLGGQASDSSIAAFAPYFPLDVLGPRLADQPDGESSAPGGWRASRVSEGPAGDGEVTAICKPYADVVTIVESDTVNPGQTAISHVPCPAGKFAVSGGADATNLDGLRLVSNAPAFISFPVYVRTFNKTEGIYEPPPAWRVAVRNDAAVARSIKVAAVCMPEATGGSIAALATLLAARARRVGDPV